jgi:hypothetical protein
MHKLMGALDRKRLNKHKYEKKSSFEPTKQKSEEKLSDNKKDKKKKKIKKPVSEEPPKDSKI